MSSLSLPWDDQPGAPNNINHVMENDEALRDKINGNIHEDNLADAAVTSRKAKLTAGALGGTAGTLALTSAYQDVAGCSLAITPLVASLLLVQATFHFQITTASSQSQGVDGALDVDGVTQTRTASAYRLETTAASAGMQLRYTVSQTWLVALTAAAHTVKLRAKHVGGTGSGDVLRDNTTLAYVLLAS